MNHRFSQVRPPAIQRIFADVARQYDIPVSWIAGGGSRKPLPEARAEVARRMISELRRRPSLNEIGSYLNRHHTSVVAMLRKPAPRPLLPYDPAEPDTSGEWAI